MSLAQKRARDDRIPARTIDAGIDAGLDIGADRRPHRGIRAIAMAEGLKGALALLAAAALAVIGPDALRHWIEGVASRVHLDAGHGALGWLLRSINPESVLVAVAVIAAYGLMRLVESWGLWRHYAWASWFGCISAAIYLPFELGALVRHPGWIEATVLAINLLVVGVLAHDIVRRGRAATGD